MGEHPAVPAAEQVGTQVPLHARQVAGQHGVQPQPHGPGRQAERSPHERVGAVGTHEAIKDDAGLPAGPVLEGRAAAVQPQHAAAGAQIRARCRGLLCHPLAEPLAVDRGHDRVLLGDHGPLAAGDDVLLREGRLDERPRHLADQPVPGDAAGADLGTDRRLALDQQHPGATGRQVGRAGQAARSAANDENLHPLVHTDQRLSPDNDPLGASNPCVLLAFIIPIR